MQKFEYLQDTAIAKTAYQGTEEDQLSFEQGQTIYVTKKDDKGLYYGEIHVHRFFFLLSFETFHFLFNRLLINRYVSVGFQLIVFKYKQQLRQHLHNNQHQVNQYLHMSVIIHR